MTELTNSLRTSDKRIDWIDTLKVLAIMGVVCIHFGYFKMYLTSFVLTSFFFCSGYTAKDRIFSKQLINDVKKIVLPYIIVSILSVVFAAGLRQLIFCDWLNLNIGLYSVSSILMPTLKLTGWSIWWFLPCMFYAKVVQNGVAKISHNRLLSLVFVIPLAIIGFFANGQYLAKGIVALGEVSIVCMAAIFMCLGYGLSYFDIKRIRPVIRLVIAILLAVIFLVLVKRGYWFDLGVRNIPEYFIGVLTGIAGTAALVFVASMIPKNGFTDYWGSKTMFLYCVHGIEHNFIPWSWIEFTMCENMPAVLVRPVLVVLRIVFIFLITWLIEKGIGAYFERKKQIL